MSLYTILHSAVGAAGAHMSQLTLSVRLFARTILQWNAVQASWPGFNGRLSQGCHWEIHVYSDSTNCQISTHAILSGGGE